MRRRKLRSRRQARARRGPPGQATIEYLLMLSAVVAEFVLLQRFMFK